DAKTFSPHHRKSTQVKRRRLRYFRRPRPNVADPTPKVGVFPLSAFDLPPFCGVFWSAVPALAVSCVRISSPGINPRGRAQKMLSSYSQKAGTRGGVGQQ